MDDVILEMSEAGHDRVAGGKLVSGFGHGGANGWILHPLDARIDRNGQQLAPDARHVLEARAGLQRHVGSRRGRDGERDHLGATRTREIAHLELALCALGRFGTAHHDENVPVERALGGDREIGHQLGSARRESEVRQEFEAGAFMLAHDAGQLDEFRPIGPARGHRLAVTVEMVVRHGGRKA